MPTSAEMVVARPKVAGLRISVGSCEFKQVGMWDATPGECLAQNRQQTVGIEQPVGLSAFGGGNIAVVLDVEQKIVVR